MKKTSTVVLALALLMPLGSVALAAPGGAAHHLGDRNPHGYFWDGYAWRSPQWWSSHQGKHLGERNSRGQYWDGGHWAAKPPAGHDNHASADNKQKIKPQH